MPYRHAWLYLLALIGLTVFAFWPGYFSRLGTAQIAWHVHAATAMAWMLLLVVQSRSVHAGRRTLHRTLGLATFVVVPLFLVGGFAVIQTMARATAGGQDPFYALWGPSLGVYDLLASFGFLWLVAMALKTRRNVALHARYLLATPLLLIGPALGRIYTGVVPGLVIHGPADFPLFRWSVHLGGLTAIAIALWLYAGNRRVGRPWLVVAGINLAESILFESVGPTLAWKRAFLALATVPEAAVALVALACAGVALWWGWSAVPTRRVIPTAT